MERVEYDLNALRACCLRELEMRKRVYPKWVAKGTYSQKKADAELDSMSLVCDYFTDAIFRAVTGQDQRGAAPDAIEAWLKDRKAKIVELVKEGRL